GAVAAAASVTLLSSCGSGSATDAPLTFWNFYSPAPQQDPNIVAQSEDRKSTRLNSSHVSISYAVFCLKKKRNIPHPGSSALVDPERHGRRRAPTRAKSKSASAVEKLKDRCVY